MRLLNPSLGELTDRISILVLKIAEAKRSNLECEHFENESCQCRQRQGQLVARLFALDKKKYLDLEIMLGNVNSELWEMEDRIRLAIRHEEGDRIVAGCAVKIVTLNDTRSELVREIDALFGEGKIEKIYSLEAVPK